MGMGAETDSDDIEAFCPGLDCLVNCNPALLNVAKSTPLYDEAGLHRSRDPGAGSRTPYHNGTTYVSKVIPRGSELFKDYGDSKSRCFISFVARLFRRPPLVPIPRVGSCRILTFLVATCGALQAGSIIGIRYLVKCLLRDITSELRSF